MTDTSRESRLACASAAFTLVELMIVVAIVAVLATVAAFAYSKYAKGGRMVEAYNMLAQIQAQQETYFGDFGTYCNASGGDTCLANNAAKFHPASFELEAKTWNPAGSTLAAWGTGQLGVKVDVGKTFFSYMTVAGLASDSYAMRDGSATRGLAPAVGRPWYFAVARADMNSDGDTTKYTEIVVTSLRTQAIVFNEGE